MKVIKSFLFNILSLLLMAGVTSCSEDSNSSDVTPSELKVSTEQFSFTADGGSSVFYVSNASKPVATSEADWCTVTAEASTSTITYKFNVSVAATSDTIDRETVINIKSGSSSKSISVKQAGVVVEPDPEPQETDTFDIPHDPITSTALEIASRMYPGWNLGNTFEACGGESYNFTDNGSLGNETYWQRSRTTKAIIDAVRDAGFKSVRIPCAWVSGHISGGTTEAPVINAEWMARVHEVVDYCIADGLYVVLNDHWDGGWLEVLGFSTSSASYKALSQSDIDAKIVTLKALWTQIATEFRDYDEHLLFAGLNEPFQEYSLFSTRHQTLTPILIQYNKAFVEAVRATGGNNENRTLVVQGPSVNISSSTQYMPADKLPESAGHLMFEVHFYDPGQFCGTYDSTIYFWGSANHSSDSNGKSHNATWGEESYMKEQFQSLRTAYSSKGYPVIIGEYAAVHRTVSVDQDKHNASVKLFYKLVNQYGIENGLVPMAWDTNDVSGHSKETGSSTIIDRSKCSVVGTYAMEGITEGVAAGQWMK